MNVSASFTVLTEARPRVCLADEIVKFRDVLAAFSKVSTSVKCSLRALLLVPNTIPILQLEKAAGPATKTPKRRMSVDCSFGQFLGVLALSRHLVSRGVRFCFSVYSPLALLCVSARAPFSSCALFTRRQCARAE